MKIARIELCLTFLSIKQIDIMKGLVNSSLPAIHGIYSTIKIFYPTETFSVVRELKYSTAVNAVLPENE